MMGAWFLSWSLQPSHAKASAFTVLRAKSDLKNRPLLARRRRSYAFRESRESGNIGASRVVTLILEGSTPT